MGVQARDFMVHEYDYGIKLQELGNGAGPYNYGEI